MTNSFPSLFTSWLHSKYFSQLTLTELTLNKRQLYLLFFMESKDNRKENQTLTWITIGVKLAEHQIIISLQMSTNRFHFHCFLIDVSKKLSLKNKFSSKFLLKTLFFCFFFVSLLYCLTQFLFDDWNKNLLKKYILFVKEISLFCDTN